MMTKKLDLSEGAEFEWQHLENKQRYSPPKFLGTDAVGDPWFLYRDDNGHWHTTFVSSNIVNKPKRHKVWLNVYPHVGAVAHNSFESAKRERGDGVVATICVEFEEGEGLDDDETT